MAGAEPLLLGPVVVAVVPLVVAAMVAGAGWPEGGAMEEEEEEPVLATPIATVKVELRSHDPFSDSVHFDPSFMPLPQEEAWLACDLSGWFEEDSLWAWPGIVIDW